MYPHAIATGTTLSATGRVCYPTANARQMVHNIRAIKCRNAYVVFIQI